MIAGDKLENKATTRIQRDLTQKELQFIKQYEITTVLKTTGNNYDVYFTTKEALEKALKFKYILAGGLSFKIEEWKMRVIIRHCQKCVKFGHREQSCKGSPVCIYCAGLNPDDTHKECPILRLTDQHKCRLCQVANEKSNHYCGDRNQSKSYNIELKYQLTISGRN
jgi:hypothetical protein